MQAMNQQIIGVALLTVLAIVGFAFVLHMAIAVR